jgi:hypothetical protein
MCFAIVAQYLCQLPYLQAAPTGKPYHITSALALRLNSENSILKHRMEILPSFHYFVLSLRANHVVRAPGGKISPLKPAAYMISSDNDIDERVES